MNIISLSLWEVGLAVLLILINAAISLALRLNLERSLILASVRTVLQLLLVGLILDVVFSLEVWQTVIALIALMTLIAGVSAVGRTHLRYAGIYFDCIASMWISGWLVSGYALFAILHDLQPWYRPQYAIPLAGMMLGNSLNGVSLGLDRFTEALRSQRDEIESLLTLGATRWEAARSAIQTAVRTGMTPIINAMMVVGIVSLPGMMTGQLLAGAEPFQAVRYQIVIMFLVAAATAIGCVGVVLLGYRRLFSTEHQLLFEKLYSIGGGNS